jgi:hypothetical protein
VHFQAPAAHAPGVDIVHQHQPVAPTRGQDRGAFFDAVGVIAERAMKRRILADAAIDQFAANGFVSRKDIRLFGHQQFVRRVGKLTENRLAPNHDDIPGVGNRACRADNMFQLSACHILAGAKSS